MVVSSSPASHSEKELEEELIHYGIRLIAHPYSNDELLSILDKVETLLVRVAQSPPETMKLALHPIMKALIGSELLSHSDEGIIVSVALCLSEIMRITAPQQPYDDAVMKQIFQHILETFEKLSNMKSHCYSKSVQILENVSKVRACVMLLDFECDTLVIDMFKLFLRIIRFSHSIDVFKNMEDIMIWIIKECDEVSRELLMSLLDSIKNENQKASFASWKLGRNVLKTCSSIVRPYVVEAVKSMSLDISGYDVILASICHETTNGESLIENENTPLTESPVAIMESQQEATPKPVDTSNGNFKSESRSKTRLNWDQTEHLKDTESPTDLQHHSLEGTQPGTNLSGRPRRRVQKSLRKHDNNYVHCKVNVLGESSFLSEDGKQIMPHMLFPVNKSVTTPSKGIGNADKNFRKMGMPKKNQVELSSEKGFEGSTTKAKPMRGSIKKEPFVHNNAENYLGESPFLSEDGKQTTPLMLSLEIKGTAQPVTTPSKDSGNAVRKFRKMGRPKKNQVDLSSEKGYEGTTTKAKIKRGSRQKEPTVRYDDENTLGRNIEIKTEGGDCSAHISFLHKNDNISKKTVKTNSSGKKAMRNKKVAQAEELAGAKIKVWWPLDHQFYEGKVASFDHVKKMHKVVYDDGEEEILNLGKERWEMIKELQPDEDCEAASHVTPVSSAMEVRKKRKGKSPREQTNNISETKRSRRNVKQLTTVKFEQNNTTRQDVLVEDE
ncbi:unnamed protein product [Cuscuta campestris]|uniref:Tudor domain-containing protein n=1 Tax=Cuscuta campestris TaxID=132261 RepID=A0A484MQH3_9ASTE|nr:unnamed protein product [Cuscuta campestris]